MQTLIVRVPELGLFFPFSLSEKVVAYKSSFNSSDKKLTISLRAVKKSDLKMNRSALRTKLISEGYTFSRPGVLYENLTEYVQETDLAPIELVRTERGWTLLSTDAAFVRAIAHALSRSGSPELFDILVAGGNVPARSK